jgi:RimJ/RimL family protein N-acetyltransferase
LTEPALSGAVRPAVPRIPPDAPRLTIPDEGIGDATVVLRVPVVDDVDAMLQAFNDPDIADAGNLPQRVTRDQAVATLPHLPALAAAGRLLPLVAVDRASGAVVGGGTLHHLDAERSIIEIGYWMLPVPASSASDHPSSNSCS